MELLTVKYTDSALEQLCGDLEWKLVEFIQGVWDGCVPGTTGAYAGYERRYELFGSALVLTCHSWPERGVWEVTARLASETLPQFNLVRIERDALRNNLSNGSGDPLGLLREYRARHTYGQLGSIPMHINGSSHGLPQAYA